MLDDNQSPVSETDVAIVGMAGRFPGARSVDALWDLVREGRSAMMPRGDDELLALGVSPSLLRDADYVKTAGMIEDVECFDAAFFDIGPRDAAMMDPQHRHFLECAWAALEHAGHVPEHFEGAIGVYAGCGMNGYMLHNLLTNRDLVDSVGMFLLRHTGNDKDFLATTASYKLNLTGPSVNVQTACSTSLVAIHLAVQGLLNRECDMALAGGVTIEVPHGQGYLYREGEVLSPDGVCRAFDAQSKGTVLASGVGVVALRRLADALADDDPILGVIKATAINNDGAGKVGYLAPSVDGHAAVVAEALGLAGVAAETIAYLEAHGTGTSVGDPIEVAALTRAFRTQTDRAGFCRLGSTKPNIGHLDTAAGVASVIKTVQAMRHRQLPPLANFTAPNPLIDIASTPFYLTKTRDEWAPNGAPRRAGISSLGVGGTNAHAILEEAPPQPPSDPPVGAQILTLSAKSEAALDRATAELARYLREQPEVNLADVAFTLQTGRQPFPHRRIVAGPDAATVAGALESGDAARVVSGTAPGAEPSVVFMFPGGGSQYPRMGQELYATEPVYRDAVDACLALLAPDLRETLRGLLFPAEGDAERAAECLQMPAVQLPAIFITEYALAQLWISWGVRPAAMTGHSLGEYTAACLAGVMSLADALALVRIRGELVERVSDVGMLSVALPEAEILALLPETLSLAAVNGPATCAVSGTAAAVGEFEALLAARGTECRRLKIAAAAHCSLLDPLLDEFRQHVERVHLRAPSIPYISNLTGTWVRPEDACDPAYWVRHLRQTVRFANGLQTLLEDPDRVLIEVGPGTGLSGLARQQPIRPRAVIASLPHPQDAVPARQFFLAAAGRAWLSGVALDWRALHGRARRRRLPLPTYPFERTRYWIEPGAALAHQGAELLVKRDDVGKWFYRPVWKRADAIGGPAVAAPSRWLLFLDDGGVGERLARLLRDGGHHVTTVRPDAEFGRVAGGGYRIDPGRPEEYDRLLAAIAADGGLPDQIVHCLSLDPLAAVPAAGRVEQAQRRSFFSLLFLGQALGSRELERPLRLTVVSSGMQGVDGEPIPHPEYATLLGPVRVMPREIAGLTSRSIDVDPARRGIFAGRAGSSRDVTARSIFEELLSTADDQVVAIRAGKRWVQDHDPVPLPEPVSGAALREGGVYLITGGLGGIGLALARHLAATCRAKLVLQGRGGLPKREDWQAWLLAHADDDKTSRRISAILEIEALGGEVLVATADICDAAAMRAVVEQARSRFGAVHGVFHAAGVLDDGLIRFKSAETAEAVLAPKLTGTLVLDEALRGESPDFIALFSSTSALLGIEGQVDYAAANAFLDTFAASRSTPKRRVVAIDWGVWREVGMAAEAAGETSSAVTAPDEPVHPLLGAPLRHNGSMHVFEATLDARDLWVLDEHRLASGAAVLPGTGYLELARSAAEQLLGDQHVELEDVFFVAPLHVPDDRGLTIRTTVTRDQDGYRFTVAGRAGDGWQEHAVGRFRRLEGGRPAPLDPAVIAARCTSATAESHQERHLSFGPRWRNLGGTKFGSQEAFATLELPDGFQADVDIYPVHPALLDIATGFALPLLDGYTADDALYVPVSYGRVRIHAPLPPRVISHARLRPATSNAEIATYDVTIMDESGTVLVEVESFSMRRVTGAAALVSAETPTTVRAASAVDQPAGASGERAAQSTIPRTYHMGILPAEGMDALGRVLGAGSLTQVLVSPVDLTALIRSIDSAVEAAKAPTVKVSRPEMSTAYAGADDEVETALVEIWESLLGVDNIGVNDDFFDLGGHSLIAVRLFNRIKATFDVDLGLAVLFEAPTIAKLASLIRASGVVTPASSDHGASEERSASIVRRTSLVPIQTAGAAPPIFCVHGMYGNVLNFREIARRLGTDQPFFGLQAHGLDGRDLPHDRIEQMAEHYIREIRQVQPNGPLLLCGYSGGGLIAFEMARQLRAAGDEVALLAMLDTFCPATIPDDSLDWRPLPSLGERAREVVRGIVTGGVPYLTGWLRGVTARLTRSSRRRAEAPLMEDEGTGATVDIGEHFQRAQGAYMLTPTDVRLTLIKAATRLERWPIPDDLGWGPYATAGVDVRSVPGSHFTMLTEPNVTALARTLRQAIARAAQVDVDQAKASHGRTVANTGTSLVR